jgi:hypothetical protein
MMLPGPSPSQPVRTAAAPSVGAEPNKPEPGVTPAPYIPSASSGVARSAPSQPRAPPSKLQSEITPHKLSAGVSGGERLAGG